MLLAVGMQGVWRFTWLLELFLTLAGLGLFYWLCCKAIKMGGGETLRKTFRLGKNFEKSLAPSVNMLFLVLVLYYVVYFVSKHFGYLDLVKGLKPFRDAFVVGVIAWMSLRWKKEVLNKKFSTDLTLLSALDKVSSIAILLLCGMFILRIFSLDVMPLIAFGGIGAAALGFAAKDVMSNFLGGIQLAATRLFSIGDLIEIPDKSLEGVVEEVGWSLTLVRDLERKLVYLPNSIFSGHLVVNASRRTERRTRQSFGLRYQDFSKLSLIAKEIKEELQKSSFLDLRRMPLVFLGNIGNFSVDLFIDIHTGPTVWKDYVLVKEAILKTVFEAVERNGAQMAYPVSLINDPDLGSSEFEQLDKSERPGENE